MRYMGTATEFLGEITYRYNSDRVSVLLTKECHGTCLLCFIYGHYICNDFDIFSNLFINDCFHLCNLFFCHGLTMAKVKSCTVCVLVGTLLFYMVAKYLTERSLKKMSCSMVLAGLCSVSSINIKLRAVTFPDHARFNVSYMTYPSTGNLNRFINNKCTCSSFDNTTVAFLTTHGSVERSLCSNDRSLITFI